MRSSYAIAILAAVGFSSQVRADGIIFQLPKDGTFVQYQMTGSETDAGDGDVKKFAGTVTLSSVGTETVKGGKCRWIEIRHTWQNKTRGDKDDRVRILKCLFPEKHLGKGKDPVKHLIRGWRSSFRGSEKKRRTRSVRRSDGSINLGQPGGAFLGGPISKAESLKEKTIVTKLGKLRCAGIRGTLQVKAGRKSIPFTFTVWLNDKVPYGVVRFELTGKEPSGDVIKMSGTVSEKGTSATTELPKQK